MTEGSSGKSQRNHVISWEQVCHLLSNHPYNQKCHNNKSNQTKRIALKILDTIFFHNTHHDNAVIRHDTGNTEQNHRHEKNTIREWFFTCKKGKVTRRKDPNVLTLQHLHDRFCRFSLANSYNATGPRIVATGYINNDTNDKMNNKDGTSLKQRVHFTEDQLKRQIYHERDTTLCKCMYMQSYLRPYEGREQCFRGSYRLVFASDYDHASLKRGKHKPDIKSDVLTQILEDPPSSNSTINDLSKLHSSPLMQWIQSEVEAMTVKIVNYLESAMESSSSHIPDNKFNRTKVLALSADFILDDNKVLWITCIDNVRISNDDLETQIHEVLKHYDEQHDEEANSSSKSILLPQVSNQNNLKTDNEKQSVSLSTSKQRKIGDKGERDKTNNGSDVINHPDNHEHVLQTKIAQLKSQLSTKESAKVDSLVKISNLRKEVHATLRLQPLVENDQKQITEQRTGNGNNANQTSKERNESYSLDSKDEITRLRQDLFNAKEENEYLLKSITERGKHDEIVEKLDKEKMYLEKMLQKEIISKNEYLKKFEDTCSELVEAKALASEDIERLKCTLQKERDNYNKLTGQIKSSNQVLEAEVKVQREYVNDLRSTSWADLAVRLKAQVEIALNEELAKSSMSITQAVSSCEERWKRQIEEMQLQHQNEITKLKEQFENDSRFNASRNQMVLEEAKHEFEQKLKQNHDQALDVIRRQEGARRLSDVKNVAKKWEQAMMEMKTHLIAEQQQKARKNLMDRDEYWQSKILKYQKQTELERNKLQEAANDELHEMIKIKDEEMQKALLNAEKQKDITIKHVLDESLKEKSEMIAQKEEEMKKLIDIEKEKVKKAIKDEMDEVTVRLKDEEKKKVDKLNGDIKRIEIEHSEVIKELQEDILQAKQSCARELKNISVEIEKKTEADVKKRINDMKQNFEHEKIQLLLGHKEAIEMVRHEAKKMVDDQLLICKEEESKKMKEALNSMSQGYDEHIQALEYDISWEKSQKQSAIDETNKLKIQVQELESSVQGLKEALDKERKRYSLNFIHIIANAFSSKRVWHDKLEELNSLRIQSQVQHEEKEQELKKKIKALEKRSIAFEHRMKLVASTLLDHKRNELVEHKTKSRDITQKIQTVTERIKKQKSKKDDLMIALSHLEDEMKMVEIQLHEHSQISAIQEGKINLVHARKKRRLDEEYEQILLKIESKRDEINVVDEEIKDLTIEKNDVNDQMRALERSLVELLVDQQKELLTISSDTGIDKLLSP